MYRLRHGRWRGATWLQAEAARFWLCAGAQREEGSTRTPMRSSPHCTELSDSCPMTMTGFVTSSSATRASSMTPPTRSPPSSPTPSSIEIAMSRPASVDWSTSACMSLRQARRFGSRSRLRRPTGAQGRAAWAVASLPRSAPHVRYGDGWHWRSHADLAGVDGASGYRDNPALRGLLAERARVGICGGGFWVGWQQPTACLADDVTALKDA